MSSQSSAKYWKQLWKKNQTENFIAFVTKAIAPILLQLWTQYQQAMQQQTDTEWLGMIVDAFSSFSEGTPAG